MGFRYACRGKKYNSRIGLPGFPEMTIRNIEQCVLIGTDVLIFADAFSYLEQAISGLDNVDQEIEIPKV